MLKKDIHRHIAGLTDGLEVGFLDFREVCELMAAQGFADVAIIVRRDWLDEEGQQETIALGATDIGLAAIRIGDYELFAGHSETEMRLKKRPPHLDLAMERCSQALYTELFMCAREK